MGKEYRDIARNTLRNIKYINNKCKHNQIET